MRACVCVLVHVCLCFFTWVGDLAKVKVGKNCVIRSGALLRPSYKKIHGSLQFFPMTVGSHTHVGERSVVEVNDKEGQDSCCTREETAGVYACPKPSLMPHLSKPLTDASTYQTGRQGRLLCLHWPRVHHWKTSYHQRLLLYP